MPASFTQLPEDVIHLIFCAAAANPELHDVVPPLAASCKSIHAVFENSKTTILRIALKSMVKGREDYKLALAFGLRQGRAEGRDQGYEDDADEDYSEEQEQEEKQPLHLNDKAKAFMIALRTYPKLSAFAKHIKYITNLQAKYRDTVPTERAIYQFPPYPRITWLRAVYHYATHGLEAEANEVDIGTDENFSDTEDIIQNAKEKADGRLALVLLLRIYVIRVLKDVLLYPPGIYGLSYSDNMDVKSQRRETGAKIYRALKSELYMSNRWELAAKLLGVWDDSLRREVDSWDVEDEDKEETFSLNPGEHGFWFDQWRAYNRAQSSRWDERMEALLLGLPSEEARVFREYLDNV